MEPEFKHLPLVRWIRDTLQSGMTVTRHVLDFMETTFGTPDLPDILAHADSSEIDTLLELLFYPDMRIQIRYETRYGSTACSSRDQAAILSILTDSPPEAALIVPGHAAPVTLKVPPHALTAFVRRLNMTWQPDAELEKALEKNWQNAQRIQARVLLRNAGVAWHPDRIQLMNRFFSMMPGKDDQALACLRYLLANLSDLTPGIDPYTFLTDKKFQYFQSLCKAETFERKRRSSNMEILMLQGVRAAHGSIDQWRAKMRLVDHICQTLFGRSQFFQQPDEYSLNLENGKERQNIREIIRLLS